MDPGGPRPPPGSILSGVHNVVYLDIRYVPHTHVHKKEKRKKKKKELDIFKTYRKKLMTRFHRIKFNYYHLHSEFLQFSFAYKLLSSLS